MGESSDDCPLANDAYEPNGNVKHDLLCNGTSWVEWNGRGKKVSARRRVRKSREPRQARSYFESLPTTSDTLRCKMKNLNRRTKEGEAKLKRDQREVKALKFESRLESLKIYEVRTSVFPLYTTAHCSHALDGHFRCVLTSNSTHKNTKTSTAQNQNSKASHFCVSCEPWNNNRARNKAFIIQAYHMRCVYNRNCLSWKPWMALRFFWSYKASGSRNKFAFFSLTFY